MASKLVDENRRLTDELLLLMSETNCQVTSKCRPETLKDLTLVECSVS
jgi:hypothetical protein